MVFKQKYHLERGYCCGNGCKHCSYHFENVTDEKKRIQLILNENKRASRTVNHSQKGSQRHSETHSRQYPS